MGGIDKAMVQQGVHQIIFSSGRRHVSVVILAVVGVLSIMALGLSSLLVPETPAKRRQRLAASDSLRNSRGPSLSTTMSVHSHRVLRSTASFFENFDYAGKFQMNNLDRLRIRLKDERKLTMEVARATASSDQPDFLDSDIPVRLPTVEDVPLTDPQPITGPYSLPSVLRALPYFDDTFGVMIYDPRRNRFILHYSENMRWISGCKKLVTTFKFLANSLRLLAPERFRFDGQEFALAISSADYPGIHWDDCLRSQRSDCIPVDEEMGLSPVLQFGSNFRELMLPTMVTMPIPQQNHLGCYHFWMLHGKVCKEYLPRSEDNPDGLVFPEALGLGWDELIPQVVWRGTDFSYLHKMYPRLRQPNLDMDVLSQIDVSGKVDTFSSSAQAMRRIYDQLIPRWKGVVLTAEAEREAERVNRRFERMLGRARRMGREAAPEVEAWENNPRTPWANIKFAGAMSRGQKMPTSEIEYYTQFEEYGIPAVGEGMTLETLGTYRYHIDLGGGGGTTWSGTIEKLGLPGLLFHHVTPTKDYFHDKMVPWVHYIPIKEDLSDLREKFNWAEANPNMAQQISAQATELARWLGTDKGMEEMFYQFYETPLRRVIQDYQPLPTNNWRDAVGELVGDELRPIMSCAGFYHHDCEGLVDDVDFTRRHDRDPHVSARKKQRRKD